MLFLVYRHFTVHNIPLESTAISTSVTAITISTTNALDTAAAVTTTKLLRYLSAVSGCGSVSSRPNTKDVMSGRTNGCHSVFTAKQSCDLV